MKSPLPSTPDFRGRRWRANLQSLLQLLLLLSLFVGLNMVSQKHFSRTDLTDQRLYSLSAETIAYLQNLDQKVEVHVTIPPNDQDEEIAQMFRDVRGLLREYQYQAPRVDGESLVRVHFHDVYRQRREAQMLMDRFQESDPHKIIFARGDNYRILHPSDLYRTEDRQRTQFQGERIFTSALLDVSDASQTTIYFTTGHGEMELDDTDPTRGLSHLTDALLSRNFRLDYLDMMATSDVPADADLVVIAGPQVPLLRNEENMIRRYLEEEQGRVMVLLEPGRRHGLEELFFEWGVLIDDVLVMDESPGSTLPSGDMIISHYGEHPITMPLLRNNLRLLVGLSRSVRQDPISLTDESLHITPLLGTSSQAWGERDYRQHRTTPTFDEDRDLPGPLTLALISERTIPSQLGIDIPGGRLLVFGMSDFLSNQRLVFPPNFNLTMNSINWIVDRDTLVNIPPRNIEKIDLMLTQEQSRRLWVTLSLGLPGAIALLGCMVFWIRRK